MSGARTAGPTLAITAGAPAANNSTTIPTSFNNTTNNVPMHTNTDYVSNMIIRWVRPVVDRRFY